MAGITAREFHDADGVEDWRALADGARACFRTGSFAAGARFVHALADLDDGPDVDLRRDEVTVTLAGFDPDLARRISAVARELDIEADPSAVQDVQLTIDALVRPEVMAFWRALLGYQDREDSAEDLIDPCRRGPSIWFQQLDAPRPQRNRIHIDVWVPHDQARARIDAAIAAGGTVVRDRAPRWVVLADPEGNEACVATWQERG
jgi:4a-hydroxytetrahydrobiopterin dehydratase